MTNLKQQSVTFINRYSLNSSVHPVIFA